MDLAANFRGHRPGRGAGCAIGIAVLLASAVFPGEAEAVRRDCRAAGDYLEYTYREFVDGSMVGQRMWRVSVLPEDMEVVASIELPTLQQVDAAACRLAALCLALQVTRESHVCENNDNLKFETVRRPPRIDDWRRSVACDHALAGDVPGLQKTSDNTVKLVETTFVATGRRDGVTRDADETVSENDHVCWEPRPDGEIDRP